MVQTVPLITTRTPAMAAGRGIEWLVSGLGLAGLVFCLLFAPSARRDSRRRTAEAAVRPVNAERTRTNRVRA